MRHDPPWQNRPWVLTEEGRASFLDSAVDCVHCAAARPSGLASTELTRLIRADPARVYAAFLDPEDVRQWMVPDGMTSEVHTFEPREGGRFRISLTYDAPTEAGKSSAQTDTYGGFFAELVPARRVVQRLEFETADPAMQGEMTITIDLRPSRGGTELTAAHTDLPPGLRPEDNELGWSISLAKLALLCETGSVEGADPS